MLNARFFLAPLLLLCAWLFCVGAVASMFQGVHSNVESTLVRSTPAAFNSGEGIATLVSIEP